jgi:hypothetical protein
VSPRSLERKEAVSITYTCNLCGETIDRNVPLVILNGNGERSGAHWVTGWVGHYHADPEVGCWQRILEIIRGADGWASGLATIPTASDESIADARAKHLPPDVPNADDGPRADEIDRSEDGGPQA